MRTKPPQPLPPATQEEFDRINTIHRHWLKWANTQRDSLLIGFSMLVCEQQPSWREVESLIFDGDCDDCSYYLAAYTREQLVDLYCLMHPRPIQGEK